jgi:hypothetical protein
MLLTVVVELNFSEVRGYGVLESTAIGRRVLLPHVERAERRNEGPQRCGYTRKPSPSSATEQRAFLLRIHSLLSLRVAYLYSSAW